MILTYTEDINGKKHTFTYDSQKVKAECVDCHKHIQGWETHENYKARGNYCQECNAKYSFLSGPKTSRDYSIVKGFHP